MDIIRRQVGDNIWLGRPAAHAQARTSVFPIRPEVLQSEDDVGRAMLGEIESLARAKDGDITIALLGGRGAQSMHRQLGEVARKGDPEGLISRLKVFTQDALAPMRMANSFSFVRDFERLLGDEFFARVRSFTPMRTDQPDLESELGHYLEELNMTGGLDILFLGHGPEPGGASHLAYIKPLAGANESDLAGVIPISASILEHHVTKFKAGGSPVNAEDEAECRRATHILTLGPAAILGARRIVQSVVDASTAPAKRESYRRVLEAEIAEDPVERSRQLNENPGLWIRLHPNVRSLVLPDLHVS